MPEIAIAAITRPIMNTFLFLLLELRLTAGRTYSMDAALKRIPSIEEKRWDIITRHRKLIEDNKKVVLRESWFDADERLQGLL
jgi:hypothetical protein